MKKAKQSIPEDLSKHIADLNKLPEQDFFSTPKVQQVQQRRTAVHSGRKKASHTADVREILQEATALHAPQQFKRVSIVMKQSIYEEALRVSKAFNLSFNALVVTMLKLAIKKGSD